MVCHSVRLWYGEPNAISNAVGYAKFFSWSAWPFRMIFTRASAVDTMLTVPRSFLFFYGRACSQPYEGANLSRGANTRF